MGKCEGQISMRRDCYPWGESGDSQAEQQHTELDKDKVREISQPPLENRTGAHLQTLRNGEKEHERLSVHLNQLIL